MRTPLQKYRQAMAEAGVEMTPAEAREQRAHLFGDIRRVLMKNNCPCPNDDDALQKWLTPDDFDFAVSVQCQAIRGD